eukprot:TRINITY_DN3422_c0_g1_i1.p2 TRINITY_DN3422_c0_g1~~TRINITY_DN3422_c0_g1_i1.p2  ORF type:complete len:275 (+),score=98.82 TRINITY_DN3422_c0_g1_i1:71-895(+)
MADAAQWNLKVKILSLDENAVSKSKSKWAAGDTLTVSIEPHATVNMLKQRISLIVMAHPKHQEVQFPQGTLLDDMTKLEAVEGVADGAQIILDVRVPPEPEAPPVVLSDDEDLFTGEEPALPEAPAESILEKELTDEEMDKQGALKQAAQDALEDGDLEQAIAKMTEAMLIGNVSAMMLAKRAELLLKKKRYKAAEADGTLALKLNPDSAKAYRARGKARRFQGNYEGSAADFAQAQKIDYDDGVADMHSYVQKRWTKIQQKAKQDEKKKAAEN